MRALAPEVRLFSLFIVECDDRGDFGLGVLKSVPRRLKPRLADAFYGTAEAVPVVQRLFPQPVSPDLPNREFSRRVRISDLYWPDACFKYMIRSRRSCGLATWKSMLLPGTSVSGSVSHCSSVDSFHTMRAWMRAGE
jgi:hypothetical protein